MEPAEPEGEPDDDGGEEPEERRPAEASSRNPEDAEDGRPGGTDGRERPDGDAPADGAEEPLGEEEDEAEGEEGGGEEEGGDREPGQGRRAADLLGDGRPLRSGQGEVGTDEAASRSEEATELVPEPGRLAAGSRTWRGRRRRNVQGLISDAAVRMTGTSRSYPLGGRAGRGGSGTRASGGQAERPSPELVGGVEEAVRSLEGRIEGLRAAPRCRPPELALELSDPLGELGRSPGDRDVGVGPEPGRVANPLGGHPGQVAENDPRMGEGSEIPRLRSLEAWPPAAEAPFQDCLGEGSPTLGIRLGGDPIKVDDLGEEVAELVEPGVLGADPTDEAGLDALDVGKRRLGQVVRSALGETALVDGRVEELARPPHELEEPIEIEEAGLFHGVHRALSGRLIAER